LERAEKYLASGTRWYECFYKSFYGHASSSTSAQQLSINF
jgi:hypothetical protein